MNIPSRSRFIHQVLIYKASTEAKDLAGDLTAPLGNPIKSGVACLVMDKGGSRKGDFDGDQEEKKVRVLFPDLTVLRLGNLIRYVNASGIVRTFLVDSFRDDQDMGRLWVADCTEIPNPSEGQ